MVDVKVRETQGVRFSSDQKGVRFAPVGCFVAQRFAEKSTEENAVDVKLAGYCIYIADSKPRTFIECVKRNVGLKKYRN